MDISQMLQDTTNRELPHGKEPKSFKEIAKDQKVDSSPMKELPHAHGKNEKDERKGKSQVEASRKRELKNRKIRCSAIKIEMDPASRVAFTKELFKIAAMHQKKALEERY